MSGWFLAALLAWLLAVGCSDWFRLRIPNALLAVGAALLLLTALAGVHPAGLSLWQVLAGATPVLLVGLALYARGWVGAGDVKFLAVLGGLTGPTRELLLIWAFAALLAAAHLAARGLLSPWLPGLPLAPSDPGLARRRRLPHGAHLALSAALVLVVLPRLP